MADHARPLASIAILIVIVIMLGIVFSVFFGIQEQGEVIRIGAILPLTGESAIAGISIQQGIEIAAEEINKAGGVRGRKIEVIFENDQYDNKIAVTAANKLISMDRIDAGIISFVHGGKAVMPIFEKNKIPLIVAWDSSNEIGEGDYTFSTGFSTEAAGRKMANYAYNKLGLRNVAIVLHQDEWSEIIASSFREEFEIFGGRIALEERVAVGETDFRTIISRIKLVGTDGLYLPLVPVGTDIFLKQANELGLKAPIMSGDALIPDVISAAGEAAEGVYFTNIYAEDNEISRGLARKYQERYGEEAPALPMVAFGYDAMLAIKAAAESVEEITHDAIKDALYSVDITGAGSPIKIRANGLSERVEKIFRVQNGEVVLIE